MSSYEIVETYIYTHTHALSFCLSFFLLSLFLSFSLSLSFSLFLYLSLSFSFFHTYPHTHPHPHPHSHPPHTEIMTGLRFQRPHSIAWSFFLFLIFPFFAGHYTPPLPEDTFHRLEKEEDDDVAGVGLVMYHSTYDMYVSSSSYDTHVSSSSYDVAEQDKASREAEMRGEEALVGLRLLQVGSIKVFKKQIRGEQALVGLRLLQVGSMKDFF